MNDKDFMLNMFKSLGTANAASLRVSASSMTGTELSQKFTDIPDWDSTKDYSSWPAGAPVQDDGQIWTLIQPHNASYYSGHPADLRALWNLTHTKDPDYAKEWVEPYGTSGMYMIDEVYKDSDGVVWKSLVDNNVHTAAQYATSWEKVE